MPKFTNQKCIYCLSFYSELTGDHILPKSWYPASTPQYLEKWQVPACRDCNLGLEKAEEDLFTRIGICLKEDDFLSQGVSQKAVRKMNPLAATDPNSLQRKSSELIRIIQDFKPCHGPDDKMQINSRHDHGESVGIAVRIPREKLETFSIKVIKGLEYKLRKKLVEADRSIFVYSHTQSDASKEFISVLDSRLSKTEKNAHRGPGFTVRYGSNPFNDGNVIYHIKILGYLEIWGQIVPDNMPIKDSIDENSDIFDQINKLFSEQDYEGVVSICENGLKINKSNDNLYYAKAHALYCLEKYEESIQNINKAIELRPHDITWLFFKASILRDFKKNNEAISVFDIAIKNNPHNYKAYYFKGSLLSFWERYEEAVINYEKALELVAEVDTLYYEYGLTKHYLGRDEEAVEIFKQAINLNPDDERFYRKLAQSLIGIKKYGEAINAFEKVESFSDKIDNVVLNNKGYCLIQVGRYGEAIQVLNRALTIKDTEALTYANLARAYSFLGEKEEASKMIEKYYDLAGPLSKMETIKAIFTKFKSKFFKLICI